MGDPASIGPEIVLKALAKESLRTHCQITVIGSRKILEKTYQHLKQIISADAMIDPEQLSIVDISLEGQLEIGRGSAVTGAASFTYLQEAIAGTLTGKYQGIVTAPIAKSLWQAAGYNYPGQTEVLAEAAGVEKFAMVFVGRSPHTGWTLRTLLATTHIPFGLNYSKIVIAGLNPHSGEEGKLGTEEQDWLLPWLAEEREKRSDIELIGPVPPDTMWVEPGQAWYGNGSKTDTADAYVALYHDQGLIPVKLMAFDRAINTTIGLPFIRTSPDHGTAFDIAGRGIANSRSMEEAIKLAIKLTARRMNLHAA
ncbi:MAG: 4-hydroxythreonine-4-phosphate dehydrogenase PdxA [Prochloron sp. SP5CPC1]|nr:4-hydroxythreonine-4-phosphate dehydrogenase PdxA [Candidatus Paraprochloron terpiosi SP5CPC1]